MYNLILPRQVKPFTDITELVENNFTIYSRPAFIYLGKDFFDKEIKNSTTFNASGNVVLRGQGHSVEYELRDALRLPDKPYKEKLMIHSEIYTANEKNPYKTRTKSGIEIRQVGNLFPLFENLKASSPFLQQNLTEKKGTSAVPNDFYDKFRSYAETQLYELLKSCRKTAAMLPNYWSKKIAQDLRRANL